MKQTQRHAWSLAGEEAVAYSLARGKAAAVTQESGEVAACSLAHERRRQQSLALGPHRDREKTPKPLLSRSSCLQPAKIACVGRVPIGSCEF